jgi:hypothetical protein
MNPQINIRLMIIASLKPDIESFANKIILERKETRKSANAGQCGKVMMASRLWIQSLKTGSMRNCWSLLNEEN